MKRVIDADDLIRRLNKVIKYGNANLQGVHSLSAEGIKEFVESHSFEIPQWHDLRKNPQDLPPVEHNVEVVCKQNYMAGEYKIIHTYAYYEDGKINTEESQYLWYELYGAEYDEEHDCYLIPKGWFECQFYNEADERYCAIDDEVIAWREIEPFEEERNNE